MNDIFASERSIILLILCVRLQSTRNIISQHRRFAALCGILLQMYSVVCVCACVCLSVCPLVASVSPTSRRSAIAEKAPCTRVRVHILIQLGLGSGSELGSGSFSAIAERLVAHNIDQKSTSETAVIRCCQEQSCFHHLGPLHQQFLGLCSQCDNYTMPCECNRSVIFNVFSSLVLF